MGLFGSHPTLQLKSAWKVRHRVYMYCCFFCFVPEGGGEYPFVHSKEHVIYPVPQTARMSSDFCVLEVQEACRK